MPSPIKTIHPRDLRAALDAGEPLVLLDVREPDEVAICRIAEARHIPMNQVPQRLGELDPAARTVVYCHHGMRSQAVAGFLVQQGFQDVANLQGGVAMWAAVCDPAMKRY